MADGKVARTRRREGLRYVMTANAVMLSIALAMAMTSRVSAATVYVDQNSPNPQPPYSTPKMAAHDIQDAVEVTTEGDTVLVEPGQYNLTNQITITNAILVQSANGAGQTILNAPTNSITWCLWISNTEAVIDGFTMQSQSEYGAGATFLAKGTVQNCNFTNYVIYTLGSEISMSGGILSNSTVTYRGGPNGSGAAIYCDNGSLVTDCRILGSNGDLPETTGIYLVNSTVTNSFISGSSAVAPGGGGPALYAVSSSVIGCTITHSWSQGFGPGGGAFLDSSLMDRCIVMGNTLYGVGVGTDQRGGVGGGGIFETNSSIRDSLIVSNTVSNLPDTGVGAGGGVFMQGGTLINCTVSGNRAASGTNAPPEGAGVYIQSGGITNSIIYLNYAQFPTSEDEWFNAGSGVLDHCCTTPDPGGMGNITQNPQFVDATNGDFRLASNSPCIAAGIVQRWMTGAEDLDGNPRTLNGTVDMGAYETQTTDPKLVQLLNPKWVHGAFVFNLLTQTNQAYSVQFAEPTAPASWQTLTNFSGTGSTMGVTNENAVAAARFYRVVAQ